MQNTEAGVIKAIINNHGFIDSMPMEEYHARSARSASNLIVQADSNCELSKYEKDTQVEKISTPLFEGTGIHTSIQAEVEEEIDKEYAIAPDVRKNSKAWTQWFEEECGDRMPCPETQMKMFKGCREASRSHSESRLFLENGFMERSGFCELMDVQVKARPDIDCAHVPASKRFPCLVDIKSRRKRQASKAAWTKDFFNYHTYLQAGLQILVWRQLGVEVDDYYYILIEKEPPYQVNVVPLGSEWIHESIFQVNQELNKWKKWLSDGSPKSYGLNQSPMIVEPWMQRKLSSV